MKPYNQPPLENEEPDVKAKRLLLGHKCYNCVNIRKPPKQMYRMIGGKK